MSDLLATIYPPDTPSLSRLALAQLRTLDDVERQTAVDTALAVVRSKIGDAPHAADFESDGVSEFPAWFTKWVLFGMVILLLAAASLSLFRLYTAGRDYFKHGCIVETVVTASGDSTRCIDDMAGLADGTPAPLRHGIKDDNQAIVVGFGTFLLAEFLIILSTIAARVFFSGFMRWVFILPIMLGMAVALVGNWVVARPHDLFGWLETLAPPVAVLFLAFIGERLALDSIRSKHAGDVAYAAALKSHRQTVGKLTEHPAYTNAYATALRQAVFAANSVGTGATSRRGLMTALTPPVWRAVVLRELAADNWFADAQTDKQTDKQTAPPVPPALQAPHESESRDAFLVSAGAPVVSQNGNGKH